MFVDRLFKSQAIGLLNSIDITQWTQNFIFHSGCLNNLCLVFSICWLSKLQTRLNKCFTYLNGSLYPGYPSLNLSHAAPQTLPWCFSPSCSSPVSLRTTLVWAFHETQKQCEKFVRPDNSFSPSSFFFFPFQRDHVHAMLHSQNRF